MSRCSREISEPMATLGSSGQPIVSDSVCFFSAATNLSKIGRSTNTRSGHRQTWPVLVNRARARPSTVASKSQSANTMAAFLPPSSKDTSFTPSATAFMMAAPVRDSPVKVTASMPGWVVSASPAEPGPKPCTTLNTPGGTPASWKASAISTADEGVSSDGLQMMVLPQISAGAAFQVSERMGRFQGEMLATTPSGLRLV